MMCFLDTFLTEKYIFVLLVFFYLIFLLVFVTLSKTNALLPVIACGFIRNVYKGARITKGMSGGGLGGVCFCCFSFNANYCA